MATNEDVLAHLGQLRSSVADAINTVVDYQRVGTKLTAGNQTSEKAKVRTVPTVRQHASNCSICTAWDGSVRSVSSE